MRHHSATIPASVLPMRIMIWYDKQSQLRTLRTMLVTYLALLTVFLLAFLPARYSASNNGRSCSTPQGGLVTNRARLPEAVESALGMIWVYKVLFLSEDNPGGWRETEGKVSRGVERVQVSQPLTIAGMAILLYIIMPLL